MENHDDRLEFPLRLSKTCLLNIRDDNTLISPIAIQAAFHALLFNETHVEKDFVKNCPLNFYNYVILSENSAIQNVSSRNILKNVSLKSN